MPLFRKRPFLSWRAMAGRIYWAFLAVVVAAGGLAFALNTGLLVVPERFNPFAPLDVLAEPNFLTSYKLARARREPSACLAALAQTGMAYEPLPDRATGPGCGFTNAVRLQNMGANGMRLGAPVSLSCPLALSFFMWEHHVLQPAAQKHYGERVASLQHLGSYACRNINRGERGEQASGGNTGSRSQHATADALDVAGLTLQSGKRLTVLKDWSGQGTDAQMLADMHDGACRFFTGVLGPDYNAVHRDHFHLETGGYWMCR
jgi:hypothetical protein